MKKFFAFLWVTVLVISVLLIIEIYYISEQDAQRTNSDGSRNAMILLKSIKNEWIDIDIVLDGERNDYDWIFIESTSKMEFEDITYAEQDSKLFSYQQYSQEFIKPTDEDYTGGLYNFNDIKLKTPSTIFLFPFKDYKMNIVVYPRKDDKPIYLDGIGIQEYTGWLKIKKVDTGQGINKSGDTQYIKNAIYIEMGYPNTLKLLIIILFISLLFIVYKIQKNIIKNKKLDFTSVGLLLSVLFGLPGINSLIKMDLITTLTFVDILTIFIYMIVLFTPFSLLFSDEKKLNRRKWI